MTNEQAKSELMQIYGLLSEEKKQALDVLMAQADGDLISRQAVFETIATWVKTSEPYDRNGWLTPRYLYDRIKTIPTAEPYKGMTNGEVLKAIFPQLAEEAIDYDWIEEDWLNSPYNPQESEEV